MTQAAVDANVASALATFARERGDAAAFVLVDAAGAAAGTISFEQLHTRVSNCAGGLRARGIEPGDRVVVFVPMSPELYVLLLAIFRIGAVAVFIDPWGGRQMIDAAATLVEPTAFIGIPKSHLLRLTSRALRRCRIKVSVPLEGGRRRVPGAIDFGRLLDQGAAGPVAETRAVTGDDPALITFTSGSTGTPKGANRTHGFLLAQHQTLERHLDQGPGDIHLTNLPIFVLHNLGCGVTTLLPPSDRAQDPNPDGAWLHGLLDAHAVTVLASSPAPIDALTRDSCRPPLPGVTRVYTGGGPVGPDLLARAGQLTPNATTTVLYGSTESEPIAHCDARDVLARRAAVHARGGIYVGHEVPEVDVILARPVDAPIELGGAAIVSLAAAAGECGEVLVAGDHVNRDYFRNEVAFRENKVVDEHGRVWHRTGDIARRDTDGGLWLLGRLTGAFEAAGRTMYPFELEVPLTNLAELARAAVVRTGAGAMVLAVEPASGANEQEAALAASRYLAGRGVGNELELRVISKVPLDKRHATKIDVAALRTLLD